MNWISAAAGAVIMALIAYGLHSLDVNHINAKHKTELAAQAVNLNSQCAAAKAITTKVSNDLQNNLLALDNDSDALNSLFPRADCISTAGMVAGTIAGHDATPAGKKLAERIGRTFEPSRVTAIVRKGEKYRVQLKACQMWAKEVWNASQQK